MENKTEKLPATKSNGTLTVKALFAQDNVKKKFQELLGSKMQGFVTSVLQCVASSDMLAKCEPNSVYHAASVAAVLDLPLNPNLGFSCIVPYKDNKSNKYFAQFQMMWRGYVQLALRSEKYKTISTSIIYEGQLVDENPLTGFVFNFKNKKSNKVIGYAAYFALLSGFSKTFYMTKEQTEAHGKRYSPTYKKNTGRWVEDFDGQSLKTVIKLLLSKYGILSIEMQKAVDMDNEVEETDFEYVDTSESLQAENKAQEELNELYELFDLKKDALKPEERKEAERVLTEKDFKLFKSTREILKSK